MKLIIGLFSIVVVASAMAKEMVRLSPESLKRMHSFSIPCAEEYNVGTSYVYKLGDPESFPRTDVYNKFLYCFAIKSGVVNADGHMNEAKLVGILGDHPLVEEVKEALRKCNEITKEDAVATAIAMHDCYGEKFPIRYVF